MYRKIHVGVLLSLFLAGQSLIALAQGPTVTKPALPKSTEGSRTSDVRPILEKLRKENKLVEGRNRIHVKKTEGYGDLSLWAIIRMSKVARWEVTDVHGNEMPTTTRQEKKKGGDKGAGGGITTNCMVCVDILHDGQRTGQYYCWKIDCKDAPKPPPSK